MRTLVIPDLHGHHELLVALLHEADVPLAPTARFIAGVRTVQLGDLANCVRESRKDDLTILRIARELLDVVLVGNHEYPYLVSPEGPSFSRITFHGFAYFNDVDEALGLLRASGILKPLLLVGQTLLTHAGVAEELAKEHGLPSAVKAAGKLQRTWRVRDGQDSPLYAQIGPRRRGLYEHQARQFGLPTCGGVLWSDWSEPRADFMQVHGHTPCHDGPEVRTRASGMQAINLDIGCGKSADRVVGLWLNDEENEETFGSFVEARL